MLSIEQIRAIVSQIRFRDWQFRVDETNGVPYIQVLFLDTDRISGNAELQRCRKWMLSYHSVPSEVVRAAHKAVRAAMEHEVDEEFKYRGVRIFNPHMDLDALVEVAKDLPVSLRDETNYVPSISK